MNSPQKLDIPTLIAQGQLDEAEKCCQTRISSEQVSAEDYYHLAIISSHRHQFPLTMAHLHKAVELAPDNLMYRFELSNLVFHQGSPKGALALYLQAFARLTRTADTNLRNIFLELLEIICTRPNSLEAGLAPHIANFGALYSANTNEGELNLMLGFVAQRLIGLDLATMPSRLLYLVFELLGYSQKGRKEYLDPIFNTVALPLLKALLKKENFHTALFLEYFIYIQHVKSVETEHCFKTVFEQLAPLMDAAGKRVSSDMPLPQRNADQEPRIAFFFHSGSILAHTQLVLTTLTPLKDMAIKPFIPEIFVAGNYCKDMDEAFSRIDVKVHWIGKQNQSAYDKLLMIKEKLRAASFDALVWVSLGVYMPFAFAMRIAPVQIWWAMKYHSIKLPSIDGYITGYSISKFKHIDGHIWRTSRYGISDWYDSGLADEASTIAKSYGENKTILGSFGREEKLDSPPFIESVCQLLKNNPNTVFLWTGRTELPSIKQLLTKHGVEKQSHFIGWVNTKVYAQVIDIFVDSFPFPCGYTAFEAMAAAKPVVFFDSREAYETGINGMIKPVIDGEMGTPEEQEDIRNIFQGSDLYPLASNTEQYISLTQRLIDDPEFRNAVGESNKRFMDAYLSDAPGMAHGYWEHFLEIIDEKREKQNF
ncbi:MAG: glycosyltransferase family 4 protein [Gammaproteobacteria bacterium]|nr:glycosyltransferase family 4 protein [Gammaproteobacteria bacterium]